MQGTLLDQRYLLGEVIGRGGMGLVHQAKDTLLKRDVAVKLLSESAIDPEGRAKLLHEARAAASLNHPNIVLVYDAGEADQHAYIVMELVDGPSTHEHPPETFEEIVNIARQICAALAHAHEHGVIHRDLKPENVLCSQAQIAKLTDFGLARSVASRLTSTGSIIGTVFYMAPELALAQDFDGRADLYALGVMLYEWSTGQLPFIADDPVAVISQHLHAPVVPPRVRNPEVPPGLDALISKLMSKDPTDRPASASEVLRSLVDWESTVIEGTLAGERTLLDRIVRGHLIGREREMLEAKILWEKSVSGAGQMLLISGEPGIGKTRLMREITTQVEVTGGKALIGECYAENQALYTPFSQIVRHTLENGPGGKTKLPDFVLADLLTLVPDLRMNFPDVPDNPPLDPQGEQNRLFENLAVMCTTMSAQTPLLIGIEDAHWADSGTLHLLLHLARRTRKNPVFIVATYREVELDKRLPFHEVLLDLNRARLANRIKLTRLGKPETKAMLSTLFDEEITPEFLDIIYHETEGNPFFIEEVCKALVESGKLYYEDNRWHRPTNINELEVPQSVRVVIQTRIGKLPAETQEVLRFAAILGREFDFDTLAGASDQDEDTLIEALEIAESAQLIGEVSRNGNVTFAFAHALIPTTLAESVRTLRRRRMHSRIAEVVKGLRPEDYDALAYHYGKAGDETQAYTYHLKAGDRAAAAYSNEDAERHYLAAMDLVTNDRDAAQLLTSLGEVQYCLSHYDDVLENWRDAINLFQSMGNLEMTARLYGRSARATWLAGDPPEGLRLGQEGLETVRDAPDSPGLALLIHEVARAHYFNGNQEQAEVLCRKSLEMAEHLGAIEVQADALTTFGVLPQSSPEVSFEALEKAIDLAETAGLLGVAERAHHNLGVVIMTNTGDHQTAMTHYLQAAEFARQRGAASEELFSLISVIGLSFGAGDLKYAESMIPKLKEKAAENPDLDYAEFELSPIEAFIVWMRGETEPAIQMLRDAKHLAQKRGDLQTIYNICTQIVWIALEIDRWGELTDWSDAEDAVSEAIEISDRGLGNKIESRIFSSVIYTRKGKLKEARRLVEEAEGLAESEPNIWGEISLKRGYSELAFAEDRFSDAIIIVEEILDTWQKMGRNLNFHVNQLDLANILATRKDVRDVELAKKILAEAHHALSKMGARYYVQIAEDMMDSLS